MMWRRATVAHQGITICAAHKAIEQPVSVQVTEFFPSKAEADAAEAMNSRAHSGKFGYRLFDGADGAQPCRMKKRGRCEQHRIENLRCAGNGREPFQPANCKLENHESPFSTGARSATDGPFSTLPSASKREPWQGQSQVVSLRFQCTMHFKCGQIAVISCSVPDSSR